MPKQLFWEWSLRTLVRVLLFSIVLGGVWAIFTLPGFGTSTSANDIRYILSFIMDGTFIYALVYMAFTIGLSMHMWGMTLYIVKLGRKEVLTGYLWSIFISMMLNLILVRFVADETGEFPITTGSVMVVAIITALIAQNTAYSVYYKYGVLDRKDRSNFEANRQDRSRIRKFMDWLLPIPREGKLFMGIVTAPLLIILAIWLASLAAHAANWQTFYSIMFSVVAGLMYGIFGLLIRTFDAIRPDSKRESLYPHFETER